MSGGRLYAGYERDDSWLPTGAGEPAALVGAWIEGSEGQRCAANGELADTLAQQGFALWSEGGRNGYFQFARSMPREGSIPRIQRCAGGSSLSSPVTPLRRSWQCRCATQRRRLPSPRRSCATRPPPRPSSERRKLAPVRDGQRVGRSAHTSAGYARTTCFPRLHSAANGSSSEPAMQSQCRIRM